MAHFEFHVQFSPEDEPVKFRFEHPNLNLVQSLARTALNGMFGGIENFPPKQQAQIEEFFARVKEAE